jgi:hypothetical protein
MKIIRLTPTDARTWRENRPLLLDAEGKVVRAITIGESRVLSNLMKKVRQIRKPVELDYTEEGRTSKIHVSFDLVGRDQIVVPKTTIDGHEVIEGREWFRKEVLRIHGECQLRNHTGRFMCVVRDPNLKRPTPKDAERMAPKPEHCQCRSWGTAHPGRHHPHCEWNAKAPEDERAFETDLKRLVAAAEPATFEKPSILSQAVVSRERYLPPEDRASVIAETTPSPEACPNSCSSWAKTKGSEEGQHHPICKFHEKWRAAHPPEGKPLTERYFLLSLTTGKVAREATLDEVRQASGDKGFLTVGDEEYTVVPEQEVKNTG